MTGDLLAVLRKWCDARMLPHSLLNNIPKLGLIVLYCNEPVAVAHLRCVEGGRGMIDGFLSNPNFTKNVYQECLDQLIIDLIKLAKFNDMSGIFGLTTNPMVMKRAKRLGFEQMPHALVSIATHGGV